MSLLGSIFPGEKELGKKDDDHRPARNGPILPGSWNARKQVSGVRRRRIIYLVLGLFAIFLFIKNIPTDLGSNRLKTDSRVLKKGASSGLPTQQDSPSGKPPRPPDSNGDDEHYFTGPVSFYKLALTLHGVASLAGRYGRNKNILFAASSLKSASEIMPLACEMASLKNNDVHFAFMGRDDLEISEIKEINGINDDDCNVHWHGRNIRSSALLLRLMLRYRRSTGLFTVEFRFSNGGQRHRGCHPYPQVRASTSNSDRQHRQRGSILRQFDKE